MADNRVRGALASWGLAFAAAALAPLPCAAGNVSVETLTGNAVSGVGPYYQDIEDAIRKFSEKDYVTALERLERAKQTVPRLPPAEIMMAQLYLDAGMAAQGVGMLEKAAQRRAEDPEAYVMLADRALKEGRATETELLFQRAAKAAETFSENPKRKQYLQQRIYGGAAAVDEAREKWKEARVKLEAWLKLDPHSAVAHERLGRVLFQLQDHKAAFAQFQSAAEADKNLLVPEMTMALLFKDPVSAEKWMKVALQKGAKDRNTQLAAARYFQKTNQFDLARKPAEEAVKLDPNSLDANVTLGLIARYVGDNKAAEAYLSKAHLLAPSNAAIINHLALVLIELPDEQSRLRALQFAELNARQNPNNPDTAATYGWVHYRLSNRGEAQRAFQAVVEATKLSAARAVSPELNYFMAHFAKDQGQTAEAVKLLKLSLNNNEPFVYRKPAQALLGQLEKREKPQSPKGAAGSGATKAAEPPTKTGASK